MADNKTKFGVLEGVLAYAKIAQADGKYQSKDFEYSVQVIVSEDEADAWDEQFKKQLAKKIKVSEFEGKYRFPCPIDGVKNVYAITLRKDATKDGEPFMTEYRPKVFLDDADGDRTDITESRLIANGSVGKVSYRITTNDYGTFAKLNNVLLDEEGFKEYISTGGKAGSEFGDDKPVKVEAARKEATQARAVKVVDDDEEEDEKPAKVTSKEAAKPVKPTKPVAKKVVVEDDDEDDSKSPF